MKNIDATSHMLFLDVETVAHFESFSELNEIGQMLWRKKVKLEVESNDIVSQSYSSKAGIFAEFAKVVCVSMGYLQKTDKNAYQMRLKSVYGEDEHEILSQLQEILDKHYPDNTLHSICGHNIREFDLPFLCRRMLVNSIDIPFILDIQNSKPWEREHIIDTMQNWKFGDIKNYTSLDLLCYTFGIQSSKSEMSGADVHNVYYQEKDLKKIAKYCEEDVFATMKVYLKQQNVNLSNIEISMKSTTL